MTIAPTKPPETPWTTEWTPGAPRIAVDRMGEGPLVVFLHGVGGNRTNWHDQLPTVAEHFTAMSWDARGYGQSDDYDGPLVYADYGHDLARVLDHYGASKAHVVGLSMGGRIAQEFYGLYPNRVATLTLVDTMWSGGELTPEQRKRFVELRVGPLLAGKTPREMAPPVAETLIGKQSPREAFDRLVESMAALHKESYIKTITASGEQPLTFDLATIAVPTLLIFGEDDRLTTPEIGRQMHERIAGSQLVVIEKAGHLSNMERPHEFNAALMDFLLTHRDLAD
ncbi:MAG: alpha/beta fold hydrolase [Dehalococcoidia bacterium]|nr:alpha/beta fold hydrolase [Dehalococcoidia bacterium]